MEHQELWESSAEAWIALAERGDNNRTYILDPAMQRIAGDLTGLIACDIGCGEGRFCRKMAQLGATVIGIEPTPALVGKARELHPEGRYIEAGGERLPLVNNSIDLVVSYVVLIDIPDFRAAISEMARVVKPGGRVVVANINPFCTTFPESWVRNEAGEFQHVIVGDYHRERGQIVAWSGIRVVNFHRPMEAYMNAFLSSGLRLTRYEEPRASEEAVARLPQLRDEQLVPYFHVMEWRKE